MTRTQAHPSEQVIDLSRCKSCNGPRHPRHYQQAEPDERITGLRLIGLTLFALWMWLALGGLVWVVMAAAS